MLALFFLGKYHSIVKIFSGNRFTNLNSINYHITDKSSGGSCSTHVIGKMLMMQKLISPALAVPVFVCRAGRRDTQLTKFNYLLCVKKTLKRSSKYVMHFQYLQLSIKV